MDSFEIEGLQYLIRYPEGFSASERYPALLFLHGAGTRGQDINQFTSNLFFRTYSTHKDLPFVDSDRVYIMGTSMGGYATWQLAMSLPAIFSAIVPICGGGMYWNASRLKNIPVWAFHGALDETVLLEESKKMVDRVNICGGNAKLTVYPEAGHNAWSSTYASREVFE